MNTFAKVFLSTGNKIYSAWASAAGTEHGVVSSLPMRRAVLQKLKKLQIAMRGTEEVYRVER